MMIFYAELLSWKFDVTVINDECKLKEKSFKIPMAKHLYMPDDNVMQR